MVQQFRFVIANGADELSQPQQSLARNFLKVLDQEIGPKIICTSYTMETPIISGIQILALESSSLTIVGKMILDGDGAVDTFYFSSESASH